jgi:hypothetical protein
MVMTIGGVRKPSCHLRLEGFLINIALDICLQMFVQRNETTHRSYKSTAKEVPPPGLRAKKRFLPLA